MTFGKRIELADKGKYYEYGKDTDEWLSAILEDYAERKYPKSKTITNNKTGERKKYLELASAFDIETTNYVNDDGEEHSAMYIWMFGIGGCVIIGRTWEEFISLMRTVSDTFGTGKDDLRLICGVHNLSFEFQFLRHRCRWTKIFARATREPLYAVNEYGIEFRDTYALTNMSLASVGSGLMKYPVKKRVGDLDYSKMRNCETRMMDEEIGYCINDVLVVMSLLTERMENENGIEKIPLTQTGYARRYCREKCMPTSRKPPYYEYKNQVEKLTLEPLEYIMIRNAFQGGFTHSNPWWTDKTVENITSYDFTSSYPAVLCFEKYPMSKGILINPKALTPERFRKYLKEYGAIMTVTIRGLDSKSTNEFYISIDKCPESENAKVSNGRIASADMIKTTITNVDYEIITKVYDFDSLQVNDMYIYKMDYLPTPYIKTVLELYSDKTTLKNVPSKEEEYQRKKELLNSLYGMSATDVCRDTIQYLNDEWMTEEVKIADAIKIYNEDENRFLSYLWGCFCTAYARRNVWSGIIECGPDYVYSDTDSIKIMHAEKHIDYIEKYNEDIKKKALLVCAIKGIPYQLCVPKTNKGIEKPLGYWDYDGHYDLFKTLGAKRYMVSEDGKLSLTVSGVNKKIAVPYLLEKYGSVEKVFAAFEDGLYLPKGESGKMVARYVDDEFSEPLTDYQGHTVQVSEKSCVHLSDGDYTLGISGIFKEFLRQLTSHYVELGSNYRFH